MSAEPLNRRRPRRARTSALPRPREFALHLSLAWRDPGRGGHRRGEAGSREGGVRLRRGADDAADVECMRNSVGRAQACFARSLAPVRPDRGRLGGLNWAPPSPGRRSLRTGVAALSLGLHAGPKQSLGSRARCVRGACSWMARTPCNLHTARERAIAARPRAPARRRFGRSASSCVRFALSARTPC
jgi:hypothetical protein